VVIADGYAFRDGYYTVPDRPGLSLTIDKKLYEKKCAKAEVLIS
jgi:L-alanine-DL-glutamate epimerase-like enolase superfamily enzyme